MSLQQIITPLYICCINSYLSNFLQFDYKYISPFKQNLINRYYDVACNYFIALIIIINKRIFFMKQWIRFSTVHFNSQSTCWLTRITQNCTLKFLYKLIPIWRPALMWINRALPPWNFIPNSKKTLLNTWPWLRTNKFNRFKIFVF